MPKIKVENYPGGIGHSFIAKKQYFCGGAHALLCLSNPGGNVAKCSFPGALLQGFGLQWVWDRVQDFFLIFFF